jgi:NAD(P) transhydrogenase subunit alpha
MVGDGALAAARVRGASLAAFWVKAGSHKVRFGPPGAFTFPWYTVHFARLISGGSFVPVLDLWSMAFVFLLATFVGFQVIQNVSRLLHTPLMSLTNAISAIAVVGSIIIAGEQRSTFSTILGTVAVAASVTNIVSGFLITDRMLKMFRERRPKS